MHFTKALISIFALACFTSAFSHEANEQGEALVARKAEFLQARADYIEARDNYVMEKRGSSSSKLSGVGKGVCVGDARPYTCVERLLGGTRRNCGPCKSSTGFGKSCTCTR